MLILNKINLMNGISIFYIYNYNEHANLTLYNSNNKISKRIFLSLLLY